MKWVWMSTSPGSPRSRQNAVTLAASTASAAGAPAGCVPPGPGGPGGAVAPDSVTCLLGGRGKPGRGLTWELVAVRRRGHAGAAGDGQAARRCVHGQVERGTRWGPRDGNHRIGVAARHDRGGDVVTEHDPL